MNYNTNKIINNNNSHHNLILMKIIKLIKPLINKCYLKIIIQII